MALGIRVSGKLSQPIASSSSGVLRRIEAWLREYSAPLLTGVWLQDPEDSPLLFVQLHPAAAPARFAAAGERVDIDVQTSSVGPGFHIYFCKLVKDLGADMEIEWDRVEDDTGFFDSGDDGAVYVDMQSWLLAVIRRTLEMHADSHRNLMIAMPAGHLFQIDEALITPLGPRSVDWMRDVTRGVRSGSDFFAWWNDQQDAVYHLRRAQCLMWRDIRWREPITADERKQMEEVASLLERSHQLDPLLAKPFAEWREIAGFLGRTVPGDLPAPSGQPSIGYRRRAVGVTLVAGWSVEVPGTFAESWHNQEIWHGWDHRRDVWISAFRAQPSPGGEQSPEKILRGQADGEGELFEFADDGLAARATLAEVEEQGRRYFRLRGRTATEGRFALSTIAFTDRRELDWALGVWKSIRR
ncbi:MAG: hypothetical protein K2X35_22670 [Bryobacteraceae bacterium]|nr:hypothetical protein [Bryobacteraceae bacterium]